MYEVIVATLASQAPLTAIAVATLYYLLSRRIDKLELRLTKLEVRIDNLEVRMSNLEQDMKRGFSNLASFNDTLITLLQTKTVISEGEALVLKNYLRTITPGTSTKYYTEEVRKRLLELLDKKLSEYTWEDVFELEEIAELINEEARVTGRMDLADYYGRLRAYIAIIRGDLIRRHVMPPEKKWLKKIQQQPTHQTHNP